MVRDVNRDRDSDIEQTTFTIEPDSKQITSVYPASDDDQKKAWKSEYNNRDAFVGGGTLGAYEPIAEYEGRHRYDPTAQWTEEEEKKLVRRLDYRICTWATLMFFALQIDRSNIGQALSDNMLDDLGLSTNQYNHGMMIFSLSFLSAEIPSQIISKKLGPDVWIPIQIMAWSLVVICQAFMTGEKSFYAMRALLGLLEGGFIPDAILYLSYFYKNTEMPLRMSYFYCSGPITSVIAALLAFGILKMRGIGGWEGWKWLFALEGALTFVIGAMSWFYLPPGPTETANWLRGKDGWFTKREEIIMVNRILRDDPAKGRMHNRQGLTFKLIWDSLMDYDLWPLYLIAITLLVPTFPVSNYVTLSLRSRGFDTFETNLLTIPAHVLSLIQLLLLAWVSERINNRMAVALFYSFWCLPLLLALQLLPANASNWSWYAVTILMIGHPYIHSIMVSLVSRNAGSVRTRTIGSAAYNMLTQAGGVIASQIYREDDRPLYRRGNKVLLGLVAWNVVMTILIKGYLMWRNKSRDRVWNEMTVEQKDHYIKTTKDEGNKRLDFRFAH